VNCTFCWDSRSVSFGTLRALQHFTSYALNETWATKHSTNFGSVLSTHSYHSCQVCLSKTWAPMYDINSRSASFESSWERTPLSLSTDASLAHAFYCPRGRHLPGYHPPRHPGRGAVPRKSGRRPGRGGRRRRRVSTGGSRLTGEAYSWLV
jgi:hypothetical protein